MTPSESNLRPNDQTQSSNVAAAEATATNQSATRWQRAKFVLQAVEVRLRFIAIFAGIGVVMVYWRTLENHWDRWTRPASPTAATTDTEYYCPMHPTVVRPGLEPNGAVPSCPICGMPLSLRKKGEAPSLPEGVLARVQLSPERVKLAGVETVAASYMPLTKEVRAVGYVSYDEALKSEIVSRVSGYIERLYIDKTFVSVREGDPLAELYSPELYNGVQELRLAQKHGAADLVASARKRLELLGIGAAEIDEVLASNTDRTRLLIRAPRSGQVVGKNVVEGAAVEAGATLFEIADLSNVWVEADVFERDLALLAVGQTVEATVEAFPGQVFVGEVSLVYPELNRETRTSRVRVSIANPDLQLRPGMYATVTVRIPLSESEPPRARLASTARPVKLSDEELIAMQQICPVTGAKLGSMGKPVQVKLGEQTVFLCCEGCEKPIKADPAKYLERLAPPPQDTVLTIPEQAVVDTGTRKVVYVEREPGLYESVEVTLGPRVGNVYPVLSGLTVGQQVVAAGSFLLDAETRLNPAASAAYFGASGQAGSSDSSPTGTSTTSRSATTREKKPSQADLENIAKLPPEDRELAIRQAVCPVTGEPLGSMGVPLKFIVKGVPVFVCCKGCEAQVREHPDKVLEKINRSQPSAAPAASPPSVPATGQRQHSH